MGLFFDVLSAINNPNQQGSIAQLASITNTIQQAATHQGVAPAQMQSALTVLGGLLRPALKQQQNVVGGAQLEGLIRQVAGSGAVGTGLQSLIPPQLQQQMIQRIAQQTGISAGALQGMLPVVLSSLMGLLNMGASTSGRGSNSLITSFLDGDRDGDADLGDVMKFAARFLNPAIAR